MYKILNNGKKINEEVILLLESMLECGKLPLDYRNFLLQYNGGIVEPENFNFFEMNYGSNINILFKINSKDADDWMSYFKLYKNRIPLNYIPIGNDSFGNLILLAFKGKNRGKVYFWDHEEEASDYEFVDESNLTLITKSFQEFLDSLK